MVKRKKKSDLRLWFKERLAEVLCVTQSGLRPVVSQWDEQSAAMCRQTVQAGPDNMDNSAPYGPSREGHFQRLHTQMGGCRRLAVHFNASEEFYFPSNCSLIRET